MTNFGDRAKNFLYSWKENGNTIVGLVSYANVFAGLALLIYRYGFILEPEDMQAVYTNVDIIFFVFSLIYLARMVLAIQWAEYLYKTWLELLIAAFILAHGIVNQAFGFKIMLYTLELTGISNAEKSYHDLLSIFLLVVLGLELTRISTKISEFNFKPASTFIFSFILLISVGTGLLMLPAMTYGNEATHYTDSMPFLDALFTSVSASCVTGLAVVDTGTYFSFKGQLIIMFLMQFGGIGIVSFATFFASFMSKGVSIKHQSIIQDVLSSESLIAARALLRRIIIITISIEAIGATLIFFSWDEDLIFKSFGQKVFFSIFHSVSAFCNAGFSLFPEGLFTDKLSHEIIFPHSGETLFHDEAIVGVRKMYSTHFIIAILIVLGGIGFGTIEELLTPSKIKERLKQPWKPLKVSTRIALTSSATLIVIGTVGFMFLESHQLRDRTIVEAVNTSFFQSVTCRTAGFNTMNFAEIDPERKEDAETAMGMQTATIILCIFLMFIGAAPGSNGGGIKSSTFFLIVRSSFASIRGQERIEIGKRNIPADLVRKAYSVFMFATTYNIIAIFFLTITESGNPDISVLEIVFEQISAFATAGLSLGITSSLSAMGKVIIIISMYIGRVGTLTLALALSNKVITNSYRYPDGHVMVG